MKLSLLHLGLLAAAGGAAYLYFRKPEGSASVTSGPHGHHGHHGHHGGHGRMGGFYGPGWGYGYPYPGDTIIVNTPDEYVRVFDPVTKQWLLVKNPGQPVVVRR